MGIITDAVATWARERWNDINLSVSDEGSQATLVFEDMSEGETFDGFIDVNEGKSWITLYFYAPNSVPESRRHAFNELISVINARTQLGCFNVVSDGRFRYRVGMDIEGGTLVPQMIQNMRNHALALFDHYYPAFMGVIFAGHSAERSLALVDGRDDETNVPVAENLDEEQLPSWEQVKGSSVLSQWAEEVKNALSSEDADKESWRLVGPAILIRHEDAEECAQLVARAASSADLGFARISADQVSGMLPGIRRKLSTLAPVLAFIEPGDWLLKGDEDDEPSDDEKTRLSTQTTLATELKTFDPEHPVIFATTSDFLDRVAPSLREVGAFDRSFIIPALDNEGLAKRFLGLLGDDICSEALMKSGPKLGALMRGDLDSRSSWELTALQLKRIAMREARKLEFNDVTNLILRGASEQSEDGKEQHSEHSRKNTAIHEAGHAAVAILESGGRNIPECATIVPGRGFQGVVMESVSYLEAGKNEMTYAVFRQRVRISLAGRAAEELVFGPMETSAGASSDLENATRYSLDAFGVWGFSPDFEMTDGAGSNLAVVIGKWAGRDYDDVYPLVRRFLTQEYAAVKTMLSDNRPLLDAIADRLIWDPFVDQGELKEICAKLGLVFEGGSTPDA